MDISVVFDLENGQRKIIRGGLNRFEVSMGGMRVYGFRYDPSTGRILLPESEDRNGRKHKSSSITRELEEQILIIINGGSSEQRQTVEEQVDPVLKKQMEEDEIRRKEYYKKIGKVQ